MDFVCEENRVIFVLNQIPDPLQSPELLSQNLKSLIVEEHVQVSKSVQQLPEELSALLIQHDFRVQLLLRYGRAVRTLVQVYALIE